MLPSLEGPAAARAERRLAEAPIIWLTTVRADGQPQASPVGFWWDGASFLILTQPGSQKVRNLRGNPKVALHLDSDGQGGEILTLEGVAALGLTPPPGDVAVAAYLDKYRALIRSLGTTPEALLAEYATAIRVTPTRARAY